jgi:hypothetical protein
MYNQPDISNSALKTSDIPADDASWEAVARFALTFDGYGAFGDSCGDIANERCARTLTELRASLFYEQRRWRHFQEEPAGDELAYLRSLVARIRSLVEAGQQE